MGSGAAELALEAPELFALPPFPAGPIKPLLGLALGLPFGEQSGDLRFGEDAVFDVANKPAIQRAGEAPP